ncbi:MAG: hypothetical protein WDM76_02920 [Limisphaerales bacterium]
MVRFTLPGRDDGISGRFGAEARHSGLRVAGQQVADIARDGLLLALRLTDQFVEHRIGQFYCRRFHGFN